jgi:hypothetical protein
LEGFAIAPDHLDEVIAKFAQPTMVTRAAGCNTLSGFRGRRAILDMRLPDRWRAQRQHVAELAQIRAAIAELSATRER